MNVWNGIAEFPAERNPVVATIGNYDGMHLGHQAILHEVRLDAHRRGLASLLITFDPHPLSVVAPDKQPSLLQTRQQKLDSLARSGPSDVLIIAFNREIAALSGEQFFSDLLGDRVRFAAIHVGENFRFGRRRSCDQVSLQRIGGWRGFSAHCVPSLRLNGETVSSSVIRAAVSDGRVERAGRMLGRPFSVVGLVVRGDGRGRGLSFPTANLEVTNDLLPARGVYVAETVVGARPHPSVVNVGVRPTFDGRRLVVEAHLLDYDGDLYGEQVELRFLARIREEMRFADAGELTAQIARDRDAAALFFRDAAAESG